jgi:sorting nexin-9/18/33
MATPPVTPPPFLSTDIPGIRPISDFDAGHNASNAWTEHLERESTYQSISDEEREEETSGRPARVIYDFEGRAEFRELYAVFSSLELGAIG